MLPDERMSGPARGGGCRVAGRGIGVRQNLESTEVAQHEQEVPQDRAARGALPGAEDGLAGGKAAPALAVAGALAAAPQTASASTSAPAAAAGHAGQATRVHQITRAHLVSRDAAGRHGRQEARTYTVRTGDTLSGIAQRFYGHAGDWPWLYHINRAKISDPNLIYTGQVFSTPADPPASVRNGTYQARQAESTAASSVADSRSPVSSPASSSRASSSRPAVRGPAVRRPAVRGVPQRPARRTPARPATACPAPAPRAGWSRPTTGRS